MQRGETDQPKSEIDQRTLIEFPRTLFTLYWNIPLLNFTYLENTQPSTATLLKMCCFILSFVRTHLQFAHLVE